ncbi:MAG TPA: phosphoribosylanthranilate isomerase [Vicinamibacterales bacterium]|nr:phosphoribosylanthranilate isomerase [Vicinamibacterales bacterium]
MNKLFVKICGITRAQDAELAAGLGANALGFVFWPGSPRYISPEAAAAIAANVPPNVLKVGVFVDQPAEEVARIMEEVGLDVAQLHGHESPAYCRELTVRLKADPTEGSEVRVGSAFRRTVIKAIAMSGNGSVNIADFDPDIVLLVDAHDPAKFGGTGKTVNWDAAREIAAARRTILAGGLNAANVKLAVRSVRPYGVDVSSGVESAPGVKDPNRLRAFFEALHE